MRVRISYIIFSLFITVVNAQYNLVTQNINFTEIFGDIPNPDRRFYRPQSYVVPIKSELMPHIPNLSATITGTSVSIEARIIYKKFELRKFSSNAPINGIPLGPWSSDDDVAPNYGTTQPLTPTAINYIMAALQKVRENEAVAIVIFNYDGRGFTYNNRGGYEKFIHDCEPKAPQGRMWHETGAADETDLCDILSHEDKTGFNIIFGSLGVFLENSKTV